jgi:hypothetical protein
MSLLGLEKHLSRFAYLAQTKFFSADEKEA